MINTKVTSVQNNLNANVEMNLEWFQHQHRKGRLTDNQFNQIRDMITILDDVYPDSWDMQIKVTEILQSVNGRMLTLLSFIPIIVIKFDEIHVTNRDNEHCTIYDMYVRIEYKNGIHSAYVPHKMHGARGKFTPAQHASGYSWSHLHRHNPASTITYSTFCYGHGGLVDITNRLQTEEWDANIFRFWLFEWKTYLEYESLEGGPYTKIEYINNKNYNCLHTIPTKELLKIIEKLEQRITMEDVDIEVLNGDIKLDRNKIANVLHNVVDSRHMLKLDANGKPYMPILLSNYVPMTTNTAIVFKKQKIELEIVEDRDAVIGGDTVHPKLADIVCKVLETRIKNSLIRN